MRQLAYEQPLPLDGQDCPSVAPANPSPANSSLGGERALKLPSPLGAPASSNLYLPGTTAGLRPAPLVKVLLESRPHSLGQTVRYRERGQVGP
ncbi:MAG: hypothetical protein ACK53L_26310, partial [Pirellulaceae bacterium]